MQYGHTPPRGITGAAPIYPIPAMAISAPGLIFRIADEKGLEISGNSFELLSE